MPADLALPLVVDYAIGKLMDGVMQAYQRRQAEAARDALLREMRKGRPWAITDDKAAAALWQYQRAAMEGAAVRNLELLAEALVTAATEKAFAPNEFRRNAEALASLSMEEIYIVAAFVRARRTVELKGDEHQDGAVPIWRAAMAELGASDAFADEDDAAAHVAPLARTGWLVPASGWGFFGYRATRAFHVVERLVDWREAEARERNRPDES